MTTFVLVHGGWAGGWVWEKLVPLLEAGGDRVVAPDLAAHGDDRTPVGEVTLDTYVDGIVDVLDAEPDPVVLAGHSSGGVIVTQVAERRPEKVRLLVYLCAYLPGNGQSLFDLGATDAEGQILPNLVFSEDQTTATVNPEAIRDVLMADCSDDDYERFVARLVAEPMAVAMTPVAVTEGRYGRVPRVYVECRQDRAISPDLQRRMYTAVPCDVVTMDTSHMVQYAAPDTLATKLQELARKTRTTVVT